MQMEWNKWLVGISEFKESHGMLWLYIVAVFMFVRCRQEDQQKEQLKHFVVFSQLMALLVLVPITATILIKVYTPFYDWHDLQGLVPWGLLLALGSVELITALQQMEIPRLPLKKSFQTIVIIISVGVLLLAGTDFHSFDVRQKADANGVPKEVSQAFAVLREEFSDKELLIAAPRNVIIYVQLYEEGWQPLYGRDLWSAKAASYINSGYTIEYEYHELLEKESLTWDEAAELTELILRGPANCVIIPAEWRYLMEEADYMIFDLSDSYTAIIKKDFIAK